MSRSTLGAVALAGVCLWAAAAPRVAWAQGCGDPPDVLIVLDRSGSMGSGGRWQAAKDAIDRMLARVGDDARFGLQLFSHGGSSCGVPQPADAVRVACGVGTAVDIGRVLEATTPGGGTPIGPALDRARLHLDAERVPGRRQYVIVITDGEGGCNAEVAAAGAAWDAGITTLMVGVGAGTDVATLDAAGAAGSGGRYRGFQADRNEELDEVLANIGLIVASEICNGADDDCDGRVDEGDPGGGLDCDTGQLGLCADGITRCRLGAVACEGAAPSEEQCNALDDDCDGQSDEEVLEPLCVTGRPGECALSMQLCVRGEYTCLPVEGTSERCNGLDDDCDGQVDEDDPDAGQPCVTDRVGLCSGGRMWCENGEMLCVPDVMPVDEVCDGVDNDCDGAVDEVAALGRRCATGQRGRCALGIEMCALGEWVCQAEGGAQVEVCNGDDDDCDGLVDEGTRDACGACAGGDAPRETCDGRDDDCDGTVDEGDLCSAGERCVEGVCAERCPPSRECSRGRVCSLDDAGSVCLDPCLLLECGDSAVCVAGACVDICAGLECAEGEMCHRGRCVVDSCVGRGCPGGEVCRGERCVPDDCAGVRCPAGGFCRDGGCVDGCAGVSCGGDERCVEGACLPDPCGAVECPDGLRCRDGACVADACAEVSCGESYACVDGFCVGDPCAAVHCARGERCVVEGSVGVCAADWVQPAATIHPCDAVECGADRRCALQRGEAFCMPVPPDGGVVDGHDGGGGRVEDGGDAAPGSDGGVGAHEAEAVGCGCRADEGGPMGLSPLLLLLWGWRRRLSAGRAS